MKVLNILELHHFRLLVCHFVINLFNKKVMRQIVLEEEEEDEEDGEQDFDDDEYDDDEQYGYGRVSDEEVDAEDGEGEDEMNGTTILANT